MLSGKLGIFVLRDGTTAQKLVLNVDAVVEESRIISSSTLSFGGEFELFGCSKLLMRYLVVLISQVDSITLYYFFLSVLIKQRTVLGYLL